MTERSYKKHYSKFLATDPERLHFAAHSHHLWPDVTREAQLQYWDDSARLIDAKWPHIFENVLGESKEHLARILNVSDSSRFAVGTNTHEFVARILSCFEPGRKLRVLTTDSEFYSFERQIIRYEELPEVSVERVPVEPFESFDERFLAAVAKGGHDLIFFSQVFFNSGFSVGDLKAIVDQVKNDQAMIVIDGYHAFTVLPTDLSEIEDRVFYMAGGYKYAQSGEGACFLYVPPGTKLRPLNTGWLADFASLGEGVKKPVKYSDDGWRFAGATLDPTGWYRFNAVMRFWQSEKLDVARVHAHVQKLQRLFVEHSEKEGLQTFNEVHRLGPIAWARLGHFLTYEVSDPAPMLSRLLVRKVILDYRGNRMRVGFGLYHDASDVKALVARLKEMGL